MSVGIEAVNTAVKQRMQHWCAGVFKDYLERVIADIESNDYTPSDVGVEVDPLEVELVGVENSHVWTDVDPLEVEQLEIEVDTESEAPVGVYLGIY